MLIGLVIRVLSSTTASYAAGCLGRDEHSAAITSLVDAMSKYAGASGRWTRLSSLPLLLSLRCPLWNNVNIHQIIFTLVDISCGAYGVVPSSACPAVRRVATGCGGLEVPPLLGRTILWTGRTSGSLGMMQSNVKVDATTTWADGSGHCVSV